MLFHKYVGANVSVKNACHTFLCFSPLRPLWNWLTETWYMPKELVLFYVAFLTVRIYINLDHFIIVQVNLPTLYHQVPSSFILVFKRLHPNLLNIVTFFTIQEVLGDHLTRLTTILTIFHPKLSGSILIETITLLPPFFSGLSKQTLSQIIHQFFGHVSITWLKRMSIKGLKEGLPENLT